VLPSAVEAYARRHRQSGPQSIDVALPRIEPDADAHPLDDLREVTRARLEWKKREAGARTGSEAFDRTAKVVETLQDPLSSFDPKGPGDAWSDLQVAYFSGYTLWNGLTAPFLYSYPGFLTEEMEPWDERGEHWRRLRITFPESVVSNARQQIAYFGPDGLLRRHDSTLGVLNGERSADYVSDYHEFQGLMMPTTRRSYVIDDTSNAAIGNPIVSIDVRSILFA